MTVYTIDHPEKGRIEFRDKKRWLWTSAILFTLMPLPIIAAYVWTENPWVLVLPLAVSFGLIPLVDFLMGTDRTNPPEEIVPQLDADPYYRYLLIASVPAHFIAVIAGAWLVGTYTLPLGFFIAFSIVMGMYSGMSINTAHEIGHKNTKLERLLSRITLAVTGYGHFCIEHNLGHHRDVSTPEDPASSRMGESIYRFMLREIPGAAKRGWRAEAARLERRGKRVWSLDNHILQSYALTLVYQGALILLFGPLLIIFFVLHNATAWFQLTSANYIEHYGLLREKKPNGRYERCQPHHSWNANHIFSNLLLFQLERHSDHHANPSRSYQSLRSFENLPELPSGYSGMYALAYWPPLWYRVMDKRLMAIAHINGDLSKVNIDPKNEAKIRARWASAGPTTA
ncbi:alkane 1-monooxygenase [Arenicella xantha]|uniref:Alkane 1-monooxygenase n=1 Tax=Arenicella xantha TaxID=644221 RepID=A0A395JNT5_9GAMM|nr:alkane 1-monooxygenase [Arenicella xantha]RBP49734.1 alkane 1-monooxygenase [Arenicella xantha]